MRSTKDGAGRGELRIYLGAAPGVGKTFAMLGEAHRRRDRGSDVVAGLIETHGRLRTAELADGIERVDTRAVFYRGSDVPELDVDAVIRRCPDVVLVDELAHSNTPGSRHAKRWQDVEDLLEAGIDVVSTVNVQHLESLNDVVQRITGVAQRETVPDAFVRSASQVELVDVAPEALRRRLVHGNVYAAEKVDAALSNFFRTGNLTALRELALLWLADQVDAALARYRADNAIADTWEARERVVVAVTGGPESETLVRRASRIAAKSSAELMVLHVVRGDGLAGVSASSMGAVRKLAVSLGASMHSVVGDDVPVTLLEFARGANATQLVLGTSRRSRWARVLDEGIGSTVVQNSGSIDVHMVTHDHASIGRRRSGPALRRPLAWVAALAVPAVAAALIHLVDGYLDLGGESALFFVVVLVVSLLGGLAPAVLSALFSALLLNFFFTEPRHSFTIAEPDNFVTTVVLLVVAVAVAVLVDAAARRSRDARSASRQAELLALFAGSVLRGADLAGLLERVRETFAQRSVAVLRSGDGLVSAVGERPPCSVDAADTAVEIADGEYALLLAGGRTRATDRRVLTAVANQAVGLIRQSELAEKAGAAAAAVESDTLRRALLSAVGHDLRTPLAAVKAAVSSLRSEEVTFSAEDTAELLATVEESADHLTALVGNLLDSSRLAAGVVRPMSVPVFLDEIVHRASWVSGSARSRLIVDVGDLSVLADEGLLERVVANLVDNAVRYAPSGHVTVAARAEGNRVKLTVADHGPGIDVESRETMFDAFQRMGDRDTTTGVGLGLSVVRGFVEAMSGTVVASDTRGGGLTVTVDLPATGQGDAAGDHEPPVRHERAQS